MKGERAAGSQILPQSPVFLLRGIPKESRAKINNLVSLEQSNYMIQNCSVVAILLSHWDNAEENNSKLNFNDLQNSEFQYIKSCFIKPCRPGSCLRGSSKICPCLSTKCTRNTGEIFKDLHTPPQFQHLRLEHLFEGAYISVIPRNK